MVLKIRFENWIRFTLIYHPSKAFVPKMLIHSIQKIASCQIWKFAIHTVSHHTTPRHATSPPRIYTTLVCYYVIFANEARLMGSRIITFWGQNKINLCSALSIKWNKVKCVVENGRIPNVLHSFVHSFICTHMYAALWSRCFFISFSCVRVCVSLFVWARVCLCLFFFYTRFHRFCISSPFQPFT